MHEEVCVCNVPSSVFSQLVLMKRNLEDKQQLKGKNGFYGTTMTVNSTYITAPLLIQACRCFFLYYQHLNRRNPKTMMDLFLNCKIWILLTYLHLLLETYCVNRPQSWESFCIIFLIPVRFTSLIIVSASCSNIKWKEQLRILHQKLQQRLQICHWDYSEPYNQ